MVSAIVIGMIRIYHVDAFAEKPFEGNPAAVCLLNEERPAAWMQSVAAEMNLAETAFVRRTGNTFELRWFTPAIEVELCGHATLASAHVLWTEQVVSKGEPVRFETKSGMLTCEQTADSIQLDFPSTPAVPVEPPAGLFEALGIRPSFVGQTKFDKFLLLDSEGAVRGLKPDFAALARIPGRGFIVTSRSSDSCFDFISRYFAPRAGVNEDPVTGSAHCALAAFWSERLGKSAMTGFQASPRGGIVHVRLAGDRVYLGGKAITILRGELI
jgi:PhzF family phenazine biosynthesis protein